MHLTNEEIALFIEGQLAKNKTEDISDHIDQCEECFEKFSLAYQIINKKGDIKTLWLDPETITNAGLMVSGKSGGETIKPVPALRPVINFLIAIIIVSGIFIILNKKDVTSKYRTNETKAGKIVLTNPIDGFSIRTVKTKFEWERNDNAVKYNFDLFNDRGRIIWDTVTNENFVYLPKGIGLKDHENYFWKVTGYSLTGSKIKSKIRLFIYDRK